MTYVTTTEVYGTAGITSTEITEANVLSAIYAAEAVVDRFTQTTYWAQQDSGTADAGAGNDELDDATKSWTADDYIGQYCWIYSGTGSGQIREITDNTTTKLTLARDWDTNPDATSLYRIFYAHNDPYVSAELRDGDDTDTIFTNEYPFVLIESVTSNSTSVTPSYIYQYPKQGKLKLSNSAEVSRWTSQDAQLTSLTYWYGVYPIPWEIKRLVLVYSSLFILQTQMGGTHNIPSTYSLPEGSLTIGQAYINIKGTWDTLMKEKEALEQQVQKYNHFV